MEQDNYIFKFCSTESALACVIVSREQELTKEVSGASTILCSKLKFIKNETLANIPIFCLDMNSMVMRTMKEEIETLK